MKLVYINDVIMMLKPLAEDSTCPIHIAAEIEQILECLPGVESDSIGNMIYAEWEKDPDMKRVDGYIYDYRCSNCHTPAHKGVYNNNDRLTKYCPECGAKMVGRR